MKRLLRITLSLGAITLLAPKVAYGQEFGTFQALLTGLTGIINELIIIAFALILLAFFWGLAKFVFNASNENARQQGKQIMVGGVIALFVAASIWGIIEFLRLELGITDKDTINVPGAPGGGN